MSKKKNEEEKEATKNQEGKAGFAKDEMEVTSIKAVAESKAETLNAESNDENAVHLNGDVAYLCTRRFLQTPAVPDAEYQELHEAIIGLDIPPYYYFALFQMNLQNLSSAWEIPIEVLRAGKLKFTPQSLSDGRCSFQILNIYNEEVCRWDEYNDENSAIELNIADLLEPNSNLISFAVIPLPGVNGTVGFSIEDMIVTYQWDATLVGVEIIAEPTKTKYLVGESFDSSGMVVKATYSDGLSCPVSSYMMSVSGFNSDAGIDSQTVSISVSWNGFTASKTMYIAVYPTQNVYYGTETEEDLKNGLQVMDIHIPDNLGASDTVPVVITIHGGSWSGGDKGGYNYMTDFITDSTQNGCNCVHVNMNYRLTKDNQQPTGFTYMHMLDDIQSAIAYLQSHTDIYHVRASKIALMGHSAGGHLALLYAYKAAKCAGCTYNDICPNVNLPEDVYCDKHKVSPAIPIELVISEAGPTDFLVKDSYGDLIPPDVNVCAMAGIEYKTVGNEYNSNELTALWNASPLKYVTSSAPYTILAYGNGVGPFQGITTYTGNAGDGIIPYAHATSLEDLLNPTSSQVGGGTGDNASQIIEGENCTLFKLFGVGHGDFGVENRVHPNTTMQECELKDVIKEYYKTIPEQLN